MGRLQSPVGVCPAKLGWLWHWRGQLKWWAGGCCCGNGELLFILCKRAASLCSASVESLYLILESFPSRSLTILFSAFFFFFYTCLPCRMKSSSHSCDSKTCFCLCYWDSFKLTLNNFFFLLYISEVSIVPSERGGRCPE